MEYVDVRVAMVTLLLSVAALVVVFVLMLRKQKRMYVARLRDSENLHSVRLGDIHRATNEVFKSDTKVAKLSTDLKLAKQEVAMLTEQRDIALASMKKLEDINNSLTAKGYAMHCGIESRDEEISELTSHRNQLQESNKQLEERCNMYVNMVAEREKEIEQHKEQLAATQNVLEDVKKDRGDTFIRYLRTGVDLKEAKAEISGLKKQLAVQKGVITKLRKKQQTKS